LNHWRILKAPSEMEEVQGGALVKYQMRGYVLQRFEYSMSFDIRWIIQETKRESGVDLER
jgi:hypothetical protein